MTEGGRERGEEGSEDEEGGGGCTVEQKNYGALIAGTSLETETRE